MAALAVVLAMAGLWVPVAGFVFSLLWPVPLIVTYVRQGPVWGLSAAVVSLVVVGLVGGPMSALLLALLLGPTVAAVGEGERRQAPPAETVVLAGVLTVVGQLAAAMIFGMISKQGMFSWVSGAVDAWFNAAALILPTVHMQSVAENLSMWQPIIREFMSVLAPVILSLASFAYIVPGFAGARLVLRLIGNHVREMLPFARWRFGWWVLITYVVGATPLAIYREIGQAWWQILAYNLEVFGEAFMLVEGMAVIYSWLVRWRLPRGFRVLVMIFLFMLGARLPLILAMAILGGLDIMFDFRGLGSRTRRGIG